MLRVFLMLGALFTLLGCDRTNELRPGALSGVRGAFHAPAFYEASPAQAERFDAPYPYREKLILPGQLQGE